MGAAMAANLVKAGFDVTVYNRSQPKVDTLVARGARPARSVAEACAADVVVSMLADDAAVAAVTFGDGGIVESAAEGTVHVSSSTISFAMAQRLTDAHAAAGQHLVSAPVFGRPDAAAAGNLFVVAAGPPTAVEIARPLLDAIGQRTFVVSEQAKGANLVKLSGNFLIGSVIESLGEAMALAGKGGVDRSEFLNVLTSTLFSAPVYKTYGAMIATEQFVPAGFPTPLGHKDIGLVLAAAEELRVPLPVAGLLRDRLLRLMAEGGETLDWSAVGGLAARDAGLGEPGASAAPTPTANR
jgi:3-hydroxyisobutyrate dehydrogenase-like beta-hydroxyacid dehydrogenase